MSCYAFSLLDLDHWHCLHKILFRQWVICSIFAWFWLLTLLVWNLIQTVSPVQLLCLISIADIAYMESHPVCESYAAPLLDFDYWHCLHGIPSSLWVLCSSFAWFQLLTLPAWNPIQSVSPVQLLFLISIADIACMKSHPGCESCAVPFLDFHCWHCLYKIPSRVWVLCSFSLLSFHCWHCLYEILSRVWVLCSSSAWFPLLTLPAWNLIQKVSPVQLCCFVWFLLLTLPAWNPIQKVSPVQLCFAWFPLLILPAWNLIQFVSLVWLLWFAWFPLLTLPAWNFIQSVSPVKFLCSAWFLLLTLPAWNLIQSVSPVQFLCFAWFPLLILPASSLWVLCSFSALLDFYC